MILFIDTSGEASHLALIKNGILLDHLSQWEKLRHSQTIHHNLEELMAKNHTNLEELKAISVMNGPGSYTGLRVGLATAKSLCYALGIPLILLNKLECLTELARTMLDENILALMPARQDEFFVSISDMDTPVNENRLMERTELNTLLNTKSYALVTFIEYEKMLDLACTSYELSLNYIARKSSYMLDGQNFSNIFTSEPFYLKKVHATISKPKFPF